MRRLSLLTGSGLYAATVLTTLDWHPVVDEFVWLFTYIQLLLNYCSDNIYLDGRSVV